MFSLPVAANQSQEEKDCLSSQTQLEMNACWSHLANVIEDKVKTRYSEIVRLLERASEKDAVTTLKLAHRSWEQYRDAHCESARQFYEGGSVARTVEATCRAKIGRNRIEDLEAAYGDHLKK